ncbi:MAG TPA: membrane protein insertase YidC [Candidatus Krumholzibacteria bacterium]|nr:membrane protein insertase YidC [Candidatus Krumholzibacteria bacterium]HPD73015.1 membrane protein insertase YidC [Candidatus Krumholzibacteria bacterium]HRY41814.1 membrane protein insertase YidC [Candidatus Krumholzibacteria bacterium]
MDRRMVLAFLLIFLVITGYQLLVNRDIARERAARQQAQSEARPEVEAADQRAGDQPAEPARESSLPAAAVDSTLTTAEAILVPVGGPEAEATVTIATPLYEIQLAGRGARITSWLGARYSDLDGRPVQLLPQGDGAVPYGADAVAFTAADLDLGRLLFATESPARIELNEGTRSVVFSLRTAGDLEIRKTYTFDADSYEILLALELVAVGPQAATARATLGVPRSVRFGWVQGIASTEGNDHLEEAAFRSFAKVRDELEFKKRGGLAKGVDRVRGTYEGPLRFAGVQNKYFTVVGLPAPDRRDDPESVTATVSLSGDQARNVQTWSIELPVDAGSAGTHAVAANRLSLYIGPQEADRLKAYGLGLEKIMELGWALVRPLTEATLWIMDQMRRFIPNYGVIIIVFSVLTKLAFYPLTRSSTQSMKKMQLLQPKIKALQEKHKDNQEKLSKAMMELYQKEKVNPMSGCLPLLLQMPVFVALYQALANTIALRNTPFVWWIKDLSKPDALFSLPFSIPFLGSDFNLLPLLMTGTMVIQTRMTPTGQVTGQMAMINTLMPVIFLFFFYQMPSGLVIYWLVNNVMTIYQTWRIHKTAAPEGGAQ